MYLHNKTTSIITTYQYNIYRLKFINIKYYVHTCIFYLGDGHGVRTPSAVSHGFMEIIYFYQYLI